MKTPPKKLLAIFGLLLISFLPLFSQAQNHVILPPTSNESAALLAQPAPTQKAVVMLCACRKHATERELSILELVVRDGAGKIQQIQIGPFFYWQCDLQIKENPACPKHN